MLVDGGCRCGRLWCDDGVYVGVGVYGIIGWLGEVLIVKFDFKSDIVWCVMFIRFIMCVVIY